MEFQPSLGTLNPERCKTPDHMTDAGVKEWLAPAPPDEPQPHLVCNEPMIDVDQPWVNSFQVIALIDAGVLWENSFKIVTWTVGNDGRAPLHMRVRFGGCMANAGPSLMDLAPGGACLIKGKVGSCFPLGRHRFCGAAVFTNDALTPQAALDAWLDIRSAVRTSLDRTKSPRVIRIGRAAPSAGPQTEVIEITRGDGGPLRLEMTDVEPRSISAKLRELEPGERYELSVTATPPKLNYGFAGQVVLTTGVEEQPQLRLLVSVEGAAEPPAPESRPGAQP
jgi:hypothetical protein